MYYSPQNDGSHISEIVNTTVCKKHEVEVGNACWYIKSTSISNRLSPAVCGARIKQFGYNGIIDPASLSHKVKPKLVGAPKVTMHTKVRTKR